MGDHATARPSAAIGLLADEEDAVRESGKSRRSIAMPCIPRCDEIPLRKTKIRGARGMKPILLALIMLLQALPG